ncbi:MAG: type IV pilus modification PilV family protein [Desulfosalsimonas sp.]
MRSSDACFASLKPQNGFTLLEVLVALSIIAIALVSVIRLQSQTIGMCEAVKFYSLAPSLAQAKITDAIMDPEDYRGGASGVFGNDHPGYSWHVEISENQPEPGDNPGLLLAEIKTRVIADGSREMSYTVSRHHPASTWELRQ